MRKTDTVILPHVVSALVNSMSYPGDPDLRHASFEALGSLGPAAGDAIRPLEDLIEGAPARPRLKKSGATVRRPSTQVSDRERTLAGEALRKIREEEKRKDP